jgi:HD superfamily phosphodiesterase
LGKKVSAKAKLNKYLEVQRIKNVHDAVKTAFERQGLIAHSWDHIYRDTINAIWIGEAEGAVMEIVIPAILLHDIGFLHNPDPAVHNIIGAEKCTDWLNDWTDVQKKKISDCIRCHKGKTVGFDMEPESLEAKVVHDADLLEKIGKIGILQGLRSFLEFGLAGLAKHQDYHNLYAIVKRRLGFENATFYTKAGQEIASRRGGLETRRVFFNSVLAELEEYED